MKDRYGSIWTNVRGSRCDDTRRGRKERKIL